MITVITPAFNAEAFISEAIQSVLNQTQKGVEYFVVDNGSTDRTAELAQKCLAGAPFGEVIHCQKAGHAAARNLALRKSSADFVAFLDADDAWVPRMLEKSLAHLREAGPEVAGVFSHSVLMLDDGTTVGRLAPRPGLYDLGDLLAGGYPPGNGSCLLVRRRCFAEAGLFDETLPSAADFELVARIAARSSSPFFSCLPEPLVRYRLHSGSVSGALSTRLSSPNRLSGLGEVLSRYAQLVPEPDRRAQAFQAPAVFAFQGGDEMRAREWLGRAMELGPGRLARDRMGRRLLGWVVAGRLGRRVLRMARRLSVDLAVRLVRFPAVAGLVRTLRASF